MVPASTVDLIPKCSPMDGRALLTNAMTGKSSSMMAPAPNVTNTPDRVGMAKDAFQWFVLTGKF